MHPTTPGLVYFSATQSGTGRELWRSDGTVAGTQRLTDLYAGSANGMLPTSEITFGKYGGLDAVFFQGFTAATGGELFRFQNGVATLHADINPGTVNSLPRHFAGDGTGLIMFRAVGPLGDEPYFVTASAGPTVVDVRVGSAPSSPTDFVKANGNDFFFAADDGTHGRELFRYRVGTGLTLIEFNPGSADSSPVLKPLGLRGIVDAVSASGFRDLYAVNLVTLTKTQLYSSPNVFAQVGGTLGVMTTPTLRIAFSYQASLGNGIGVTDGTPAGTVLALQQLLVNPFSLAVLPSVMLYVSGLTTEFGVADVLALSNTTTSSARITPAGATGSGGFDMAYEMPGGSFLFTTPTAWVSDGTASGTKVLPGPASTGAEFSPLFAGKRFFAGSLPASGSELWATDGSAAGTALVKDLAPGTGSSTPTDFSVVGETLVFTSTVPLSGVSILYRSNGTSAGTQALAPMTGTLAARHVSLGNQVVYMTATPGFVGTVQMWGTDGTASGTALLGSFTIERTFVQQDLSNVVVSGGKLYVAVHRTVGWDLWVSDGTVSGTHLVKNLDLPYPPTLRHAPGTVDGILFAASGNGEGYELWRSTGFAATTSRLRDINPGANSSSPVFLEETGPYLLLAADDGTHGRELWVTDGTSLGTMLLRDILPGIASTYPKVIGKLGNKVLLVANDQLWVTSGTAFSTSPLFTFVDTVTISRGAQIGNRLVFCAHDSSALDYDRPFVTDGTTAGTLLLKDIRATATWAFAIPSAGKALLRAGTTQTGQELWVTDGTPAGTVPHADLRPYARGSYPTQPVLVGNKLLFYADDGVHGWEPFAMTSMAGAFAFGSGCPGTGGLVPTIVSGGVPYLGNRSFAFAVAQGLPNAPCALFIGFGAGDLALGGGCSLLFSLAAPTVSLNAFTDARGSVQVVVPIPASSNLEGLQAFGQFVVVDPQGSYSGLASFSDGLRVILGN